MVRHGQPESTFFSNHLFTVLKTVLSRQTFFHYSLTRSKPLSSLSTNRGRPGQQQGWVDHVGSPSWGNICPTCPSVPQLQSTERCFQGLFKSFKPFKSFVNEIVWILPFLPTVKVSFWAESSVAKLRFFGFSASASCVQLFLAGGILGSGAWSWQRQCAEICAGAADVTLCCNWHTLTALKAFYNL